MYIDAQNLFFEDKPVAASLTSDVVDLGTGGAFMHPLYIDVKLTAPMTSGSMDSFKVQSAATEAFTNPVDEVEIFVATSIDQTAKALTLAQFFCPIKVGNRYIRLVGTGTTPVGGKVTASMVNGIKVEM